MKAKNLLIIAPLVAAIAVPALAGRPVVGGNKHQSFHSSELNGQSDVEEDLGEIDEYDETAFSNNLRGSVSVKGQYTSNAELSGNHGSGDFLFLPALEVGYNQPLGKGFALDIAAKFDLALYARYEERAFMAYSLPITLEWRPKPNAPRVFIMGEPHRYDSLDTGDRITQAINLTAGTDYGIPLNAGASLLVFGYQFSNYFSDPTIDNRSSHRGILSFAHQFSPRLIGQAFYSYQYTDYQDIDRRDHRHILGVSFIYQFTDHLFGNIGGSWVDNDSDQDRASYQSAGAQLGVTWQF